MSQFDPRFEDLPVTLPIFPLAGVLLLPRGVLPLNIFEPRYLNMVQDALAGSRMIGMTQPCQKVEGCRPPVYPLCCAGRVVSFEESDDGRFLINLKGVSRFRIVEELPTTRGYRCVKADWDSYKGDLTCQMEARIRESGPEKICRDDLFKSLKAYFDAQGIRASWQSLKEAEDERLVNSIAMICPFEPSEKQALLEAPTLADRAEVLTTLVKMAALDSGAGCGDKPKQ